MAAVTWFDWLRFRRSSCDCLCRSSIKHETAPDPLSGSRNRSSSRRPTPTTALLLQQEHRHPTVAVPPNAPPPRGTGRDPRQVGSAGDAGGSGPIGARAPPGTPGRPGARCARPYAAPTARTESTPFAGERYQPIEATRRTPEPREAIPEPITPKKVAELLLDEAGQPLSVAQVGRLRTKRLEVAHHLITARPARAAAAHSSSTGRPRQTERIARATARGERNWGLFK